MEGNPLNRIDPSGLDWWDPRDNALPALGNAGKASGDFVIRNRATIASLGAVAACIGTIGTGCVIATTIAVGVRSQERFGEHGINRDTVRVAVFDATFSFATLGLVRVPGQFATARLGEGTVPVVYGRVSKFLVESGMSGMLSGIGYYARRELDSELDC